MKFVVFCFVIAAANSAANAANYDDFFSGDELAMSGSALSPISALMLPGLDSPQKSTVQRLIGLLRLVRTVVRLGGRLLGGRAGGALPFPLSLADETPEAEDLVEDANTNDADFMGSPSEDIMNAPSTMPGGRLRALITFLKPIIRLVVKVVTRLLARRLGGGAGGILLTEEDEGAKEAPDGHAAYLYPGLMPHQQ